MPFLYLKDGEVHPTEEGLMIPQVKAVYSSDKTEGKRFYKDVLMYVFYVYNQSGIYKDMFEDYRRKTVIERHLPKRSAEELEANSKVANLIKEYLDRQMTKTERLYYQLEKDMESLLKRVSSIPYTRTVKTKVKWVNDDQEEVLLPVDIEMDNSEEKYKAMKLAETLIDYGEKLKNKISKEKIEIKKNNHGRLFDKKMN
jgi:hypothetical protein